MTLSHRMSATLLAGVCTLGFAAANAAELPSCTHLTSSFVFTEFMDRARVRGAREQRLYLRPAHPELCSSLLDPLDCKARAYVIADDVVTVGNVCGTWANVMFEGKRSRSTGWVELDRLERLSPDAKTLDERSKWLYKPEGDPLLVAAFSGDNEGLRKLASGDPDILAKQGYDALYAAARQDHLGATATLLDLGVGPMGPNACQQLTNVATNSDVRILDLLVSRGADVNCKTEIERRTPLMGVAATFQGMESISRAMGHTKNRDLMASAKLLLAKGARIDDVDVWGGSALRISIEPNNVDVASLLLNAGADVNNYVDDSTSVGVQRGNTTLMAAIFYFPSGRDPTMVRLLVKHGADVNYRNKRTYNEECDRTTYGKCTFQGQTALTRAVSDGQYTVVKLLLENGADPLLPRTDGKTSTEIACERKEAEIAELIGSYVDRMQGRKQSTAPCTTN